MTGLDAGSVASILEQSMRRTLDALGDMGRPRGRAHAAGTLVSLVSRFARPREDSQTTSYFSIRHGSASPSAIQAFQAGRAITASM
jgi:hypothetical protein